MARRVFIVEDNHLVSIELQRMVGLLGDEVAGTAATMDEAQQLSAQGDFDVVLLDVDLGGQSIWPVADDLLDRGIPFIFISGYSARLLPSKYKSQAYLEKPFDHAELNCKLAEVAPEVKARGR